MPVIKHNVYLVLLLIASTISIPVLSLAKDGCGGDCTKCHKLSVNNATYLFKGTGLNVKSVNPAPANGLFEVLVEKDEKRGVVFIDFGKKYIIQGIMLSLKDFKPVAAHEQDLQQPKSALTLDVNTLPVESSFIIGNPKGTKKLYVFTDTDCPYCRRLHSELQQLEKIAPDVAIHIMLFPLPMHPAAYDKSKAIISTKNRKMLDDGFEGKDVPKPKGDEGKKEIDGIINFTNSHAISGTPTLVLPNGKVVNGSVNAEMLKKLIMEN